MFVDFVLFLFAKHISVSLCLLYTKTPLILAKNVFDDLFAEHLSVPFIQLKLAKSSHHTVNRRNPAPVDK